jgi:hypothetical protein
MRDRRSVIQTLLNDPPYLAIVHVLQLGMLATFVLVVIGGLLSSWFEAQSRVTSFALLRALGADVGQIARIFLWEQSITYGAAVMLGIALGLMLSFALIPSLVFTSGAALFGPVSAISAEFYAIQQTPPVHVLLPQSLGWALAAYAVICIVAIGLMSGLAVRRSIEGALRFNED